MNDAVLSFLKENKVFKMIKNSTNTSSSYINLYPLLKELNVVYSAQKVIFCKFRSSPAYIPLVSFSALIAFVHAPFYFLIRPFSTTKGLQVSDVKRGIFQWSVRYSVYCTFDLNGRIVLSSRWIKGSR